MINEVEQFQPRGLYVLVLPQEMTAKIGSIVIPDRWQTREPIGEVIKVGKGEYRRKGDVQITILPQVVPGDIIIYATHTNRFGAIPMKLDGKRYWLIDERDILGILSDVKEEVKHGT